MPPRSKKKTTMLFHVAVDRGGDVTYQDFEFKKPDDTVSSFLKDFVQSLGGNSISTLDVKLFDASKKKIFSDQLSDSLSKVYNIRKLKLNGLNTIKSYFGEELDYTKGPN